MANFPSLLTQLGVIGVISGNEIRDRCPLHQDNNPSFSMNIHNGLFICFSGCGQGEFTNLVQRVLNCDYQEANNWIISNGQQLGVEQMSKRLELELSRSYGHADYKPVDMGWHAYYQTLTDKIMPTWFLARGFTWDTIWHWKIKYDPVLDSVTIPV